MNIPIVMTSQVQGLHPRVEAGIRRAGQPVVHHVECRGRYHAEEEKNRCVNIAKGRTAALRIAERYNAEHFLFLDADIVLPAGAIEMLLATGKPAVGAWFSQPSGIYVGGRWVADNVFHHYHEKKPGLWPTHLLSLGCTLLHRSLIEGHVFSPGINHHCKDVHGNVYHIADSGAFSNYLIDRGVPMYLDGEVEAQHITDQ